ERLFAQGDAPLLVESLGGVFADGHYLIEGRERQVPVAGVDVAPTLFVNREAVDWTVYELCGPLIGTKRLPGVIFFVEVVLTHHEPGLGDPLFVVGVLLDDTLEVLRTLTGALNLHQG